MWSAAFALSFRVQCGPWRFVDTIMAHKFALAISAVVPLHSCGKSWTISESGKPESPEKQHVGMTSFLPYPWFLDTNVLIQFHRLEFFSAQSAITAIGWETIHPMTSRARRAPSISSHCLKCESTTMSWRC
ncbi:hypothetical protein P154DRAFT_81764 [Amniculicola lignicola CBS 123094]|uniref:Uncharacterized protein n=1 Tax=Amniculicola lignicola CBS 123094 TaxID=1392246 RepID=A0A6A5WRT3_9PLEO|nr:hypothetical protein P154DRAFT_81764 [Amniculicola lignicola CBS 123094]